MTTLGILIISCYTLNISAVFASLTHIPDGACVYHLISLPAVSAYILWEPDPHRSHHTVAHQDIPIQVMQRQMHPLPTPPRHPQSLCDCLTPTLPPTITSYCGTPEHFHSGNTAIRVLYCVSMTQDCVRSHLLPALNTKTGLGDSTDVTPACVHNISPPLGPHTSPLTLSLLLVTSESDPCWFHRILVHQLAQQ